MPRFYDITIDGDGGVVICESGSKMTGSLDLGDGANASAVDVENLSHIDINSGAYLLVNFGTSTPGEIRVGTSPPGNAPGRIRVQGVATLGEVGEIVLEGAAGEGGKLTVGENAHIDIDSGSGLGIGLVGYGYTGSKAQLYVNEYGVIDVQASGGNGGEIRLAGSGARISTKNGADVNVENSSGAIGATLSGGAGSGSPARALVEVKNTLGEFACRGPTGDIVMSDGFMAVQHGAGIVYESSSGSSTYRLISEATVDTDDIKARWYQSCEAGVGSSRSMLFYTLNARWNGSLWEKDLSGQPALRMALPARQSVSSLQVSYRDLDTDWTDAAWDLVQVELGMTDVSGNLVGLLKMVGASLPIASTPQPNTLYENNMVKAYMYARINAGSVVEGPVGFNLEIDALNSDHVQLGFLTPMSSASYCILPGSARKYGRWTTVSGATANDFDYYISSGTHSAPTQYNPNTEAEYYIDVIVMGNQT